MGCGLQRVGGFLPVALLAPEPRCRRRGRPGMGLCAPCLRLGPE